MSIDNLQTPPFFPNELCPSVLTTRALEQKKSNPFPNSFVILSQNPLGKSSIALFVWSLNDKKKPKENLQKCLLPSRGKPNEITALKYEGRHEARQGLVLFSFKTAFFSR